MDYSSDLVIVGYILSYPLIINLGTFTSNFMAFCWKNQACQKKKNLYQKWRYDTVFANSYALFVQHNDTRLTPYCLFTKFRY